MIDRRGVGRSLLIAISLAAAGLPGSTETEMTTTVRNPTDSRVARPIAIEPAATSGDPATDRPITIHSTGRGAPWVTMTDGRPIVARFTGADIAAARIANGGATPLALAAGDFDEDGMPDVVASYGTESGGYITLHRGNVDAVYPNTSEARARRASGVLTDAPFHPDALLFDARERPDLVAVGDFDADGHQDLVSARYGADGLAYYRGDGRGSLHPAEVLELPGRVTAMTAGEINRRDGLTDIVVGIESENGWQALVFEGPSGALRHPPESVNLPAPAIDLSLVRPDDGPYFDLAVATARDVIIVTGRDRRLSSARERRTMVASPQTARFTMPFSIAAMTVGDFDGDRAIDVALVDGDGALHVGARKDLGEFASGRARTTTATALPPDSVRPRGDDGRRHLRLLTARLSTGPGDDLLLTHRSGRSIDVRISRPPASNRTTPGAAPHRPDWIPFEVEGEPVAVLPMRLNGDARSDLVVLSEGSGSPSTIVSDFFTTFVVVNTNATGAGSLHQAITDANATPGADIIWFDIPGSGPHTIAITSGLPVIVESVLIDATTEPDYAGSPVVEIDASASPTAHALDVNAFVVTIRGLVINSASGSGIHVRAGDIIIEGNFIGTNVAGTIPAPNQTGISASNTVDLTVGGTTLAASNVISGNMGDGIRITGSAQADIQLNIIGADAPTAALGVPNARGIFIVDTAFTDIGVAASSSGNLISGNSGNGIEIDADSVGTIMQGNFVGTDGFGTGSVGNGSGIVIRGTFSQVGGTTTSARNHIDANTFDGITIDTAGMPGLNGVQGNFIGVNVFGNGALGNGLNGVTITNSSENLIGGTTASTRNLISGNTFSGIELSTGSFDNEVLGNYIGTDISGGTAIPNTFCGVTTNDSADNLIGDSGTGGNLISGNAAGVCLWNPGSTGNRVEGNLIGTDPAGTSAVPNALYGVDVNFSSNNRIGDDLASGNLISGNGGPGVLIRQSTGTMLEGNLIGVQVPNGEHGVRILGGSGNFIGGATPDEGNNISGNTQHGIFLDATTANHVRNNIIGLDTMASVPLPNGIVGILIQEGSANQIGGPAATERNVISANAGDGVQIIESDGNLILGNAIGTDASGTINLGNGGAGVRLSNASSNTVGLGSSTGNRIANSGFAGVLVESGVSNSIRSNQIYMNGGLGIDLQADGVTTNDFQDPDVGANQRQNFPVLSNVTTTGGLLTWDLAVNSTPSSGFSVDFYHAPVCDASGHGEGATYIVSYTVGTDGAGDYSEAGIEWPATLLEGEFLTATMTDAMGNTSEFSDCSAATGVAPLSLEGVGWDPGLGPRIEWEDSPGAFAYNIYVGSISNLPFLSSPTPDSCLQAAIQGATFIDISDAQNPPLGEALWWIVRPEGPYGLGDPAGGSSGPRDHLSTGDCGVSCAHDKWAAGTALVSACDPCVGMICGADPYCCDTEWDSICVDEVSTICGSVDFPGGQGVCQHSICDTGVALQGSCDEPTISPSCVKILCGVDPYCCDTEWDSICVGEVATICGKSCL